MCSNKAWECAWSMDQMIENANNWSLAGDVALLNSLQQFADKLLEKTQITNNNIDDLTNNLAETNLELNIAQNRFQSLRNTQFIESRVYDDDDDDDADDGALSQINQEPKMIEDRDEDHTDEITTAISCGLDVLDRYFDKIEVTISDSEDDELPSYVLRPKDLYIDRQLPYIIGTDEWHRKWHVGLEDSSDESDTEKISDNYSETDSESTADLQLTFDRSQIKSDTSSELDFSKRDLINNNNKQQLINDDDDDDNDQSSGVETKTLPPNFAQQLTEKLDHIVRKIDVPEIVPRTEVNTRPLQKKVPYNDVFFDEPPPLDDVPVKTKTGLFSTSGGLFDDDDDDDDDLWSSSKSNQMPHQQLNDNKTNDHQRGLFDHNNRDDDDGIFKTEHNRFKPQLPVFNEEPPPVQEERKKPVGGVSIFGNNDLFNKKQLKHHEDTDEDKAIKQNIDDNDNKPMKTITLFDDDDNDLFKDDLFSNDITTKKFTSNLFNDDNDLFIEKQSKDELLQHPNNGNSINTVKSNDNSLKLFDTPTSSSIDDHLFNDFPKQVNQQIPNKKDDITSKLSTIKLFDSDDNDDDDDLFKLNVDTNDGLFDPTPPLHNVVNDDDDDDDWETKPDGDDDYQNTKIQSKSLFDDDDDDVDINPDLHQKQSLSHHSILDDTPPVLENDNNLIINDNDRKEVRTDEIQSPPGKLKHNLNINVAALIPGAVVPLKRREIPEIPTKNDNITISSLIEVKNSDVFENKTIDTTDHIEVLQSVTKDRAKLPLNRRPSTRRGRKAALRTSSKDFKLQDNLDDADDDNNEIEVKNNEIVNQETNKTTNLFHNKTKLSNDNFDDLFKNVGEMIKVDRTKFEVKSPKINDQNPIKDDKKTKGLFDDDDDDDDNSDSELFATKKLMNPQKPTKSLFDDDLDDDDDIFKTTTSHSKKSEIKIASERKLMKSTNNSGIKKLDPSQPVDDPLGILNFNEN